LIFSLYNNILPACSPGENNEEVDRRNGALAWLEESQEDDEKIRLVIAAQLVEEIRAAVYTQTGYHCSAGIAHNKVIIIIK
jgi:DNA polymerase eta